MRRGKFTVNEVEERTRVPASTLRQWERRYGFPKPERSESGYRLYSEVDLGHIDAMKRHIAEGIPASRAAELVRGAPARRTAGARALAGLEEELVAALSGLDEEAADRVLSEAFSLHPPEDVVTGAMAGAAGRLEELRRQGALESPVVSAASSYLEGRVRSLLAHIPAVRAATPTLVGCAPADHQELVPLVMTLLLRRRGLRAHHLGANLQLSDLAELASRLRPVAVVLSAAAPASLVPLDEDVELLAGLAPAVFLVEGGPERSLRMPASLEPYRLPAAGLVEGAQLLVDEIRDREAA